MPLFIVITCSMRITSREKIETFFGMPFDRVINELHWKKGISINKIAKMCGMSHTPFINLSKLTNLRLRKQSEASALNMSSLNLDSSIRDKIALKKQKTYSKKLFPQELAFKHFLDKISLKYEMQKPIGPYNVDFFIEHKNLCIEIDSRYKWGNDRIKAAKEKDSFLTKKGFKVIRLNKVWLNDIILFINLII